MDDPRCRVLSTRTELLAHAEAWNSLWERSTARQPTVRAEGVNNWLEHFGGDRPFTAVCVEDCGKLVAALPLLRDTVGGVFPVYKLPVNCWANAGDLLVDRTVDLSAAVEHIVAGLEELGSAALSLEEITIGARQWIEFQRVVAHLGGVCFNPERQPVAVVDIWGDWEAYQRSWSRNHRGAVKRSHRKLLGQGDLRLERHRSPGQQLERLLRQAFLIENRTWKGDAGTSVLQTPGMLEYMLQEAQWVARSGHLDLWLLYFKDQPIAFEYCHFAKGVCFSHKIGYEPDYAKYGPGRLLRYLQLQDYFADAECRLFDMLGVICDSKAKWATRVYETGHLYASVGGRLSNSLLRTYAATRRCVRAIRGDKDPEIPKIGAREYLDAVESESTEEQFQPVEVELG